MSYRGTDFYGILNLNRALVDQLRSYLDSKEAYLADLLQLAFIHISHRHAPVLKGSVCLRLSQAIESLIKGMKELDEEDIEEHDWKKVVSRVNQILWEYVEILEESVQELFQQVKQLGIDKWTEEFFEVVEALKELLLHRVEDFIWSLRSLEDLLLNYRALCQKKKNVWILFGKIISRFVSLLDRNLLLNLFSTQEYLTTHFKEFKVRFDAYQAIHEKIEQSEEKFAYFPTFSSLEEEAKIKFLTLYRLTKIWEENTKAKILTREDLAKTVKQYTPPGKVLLLLKSYFNKLKSQLFNMSIEWKMNKNIQLKEKVVLLENELKALRAVMSRYREMLLSTDPNPYIRSRLGFSEWIVGPEPRKTKELLDCIYDAEKFGGYIEHLKKTIEAGFPLDEIGKRRKLEREIQTVLHEMGQPLASRSLIRTRTEQLINLLDECDELGGTVGDMTSFISRVLIRAMRYDWKYQVLPENPKFNDLLFIHLGLIRKEEDISHDKRGQKFKAIIHQIENWVRKSDVFKHSHEIEHDISDVKELLQEFLAFSNRKISGAQEGSAQQEKIFNTLTYQLLQYRDLFAHFFYFLRNYGTDGKLMRNQFLFVDQYLEAVELLLQAPNHQSAQRGWETRF